MTILIKFHKDRTKIVAKFWACALFSCSPFTLQSSNLPHHEIDQTNESNNGFANFALVDLLNESQLRWAR